jgi:predicted permease
MRLHPVMRNLARDRGFTIAAALTLALGIGLSTAVFTVANALLLRSLPVPRQERLLVLWGQSPDRSFAHYPFSYNTARQFARATKAFERVAFSTYEGAWPQPIRDHGGVSRLRQALVSGDFFEVLGAAPVLGRALRPSDDVMGASPVVVLSHGAWLRQFGGDSAVLGRQIVLHGNGIAYTIVGVMPQGLDYPRGTDFWAPLVPARTKPGTDSTVADVDLIARLRLGVPTSAARDELTAFFSRTGASVWERGMHPVVNPLPLLILGDARPAVIAFAAAAGLLLLITCINVANLLLLRGLARIREMAVRSALGAGRATIVRQLMSENAVLALIGGSLGGLVAAGAVRSFVAFAPASVPRLAEIHVDTTALVGAVLVTFVAMLFFGLAPAIATSRVELQEVLRSGARETTSRRSRAATELLVVGQVALAVLVLSAAGLIARSLIRLERAKLSFEASQLLIGELAFRFDDVETREKQMMLLEKLLPVVRGVPGVRAVSPVVAIPFAGTGGWDGRLASEDQSDDEASRNPMLNMEVVVPDYFKTLHLPLLRGRPFTEDDREGAPLAVVLSQSAVRHYWPNADPIGRHLRMGGDRRRTFTVVGVVPDTRYRDLRDARPSVYFALRQSIFPFAPLNLAIRTDRAPADVVQSLRLAIANGVPGVALANAAPFDTFLARPLEQPRLNAFLLSVFAGAAVMLAGIGLFGVMATMVKRRTRELGVRMALGAAASDLRLMVMRRGLTIALSGTVLGLAGAIAANHLLTAILYEVSATDAVTLVMVAGLLLAVAAIATAIPARASTRVNPLLALQHE